MIWISVLVVITSILLWVYYERTYKYWKRRGVPQTTPWLFLGDTWSKILGQKNFIEWMTSIYYKYPDSKYVGLYQFHQPILMVKDPELIKQVAIKDFEYFTDHNVMTVSEDADPLWNKNLFSLKGQQWRDMRALLSASFTSSKMKVMYGLISDEAKKFADYFAKQDKDLIEVELKDLFSRYATDVIATTSFGINVNSLESRNNEFLLMGREIGNFSGIKFVLRFLGQVAFPKLFKLFKIGFTSDHVRKYFTQIIEETIKVREEQGIVRPDMINLLLEVKNGRKNTEEKQGTESEFAAVQEYAEIDPKKETKITNLDIASQAIIFFLGGFETVSNSMCFACYELAVNPHIQDALRAEIKDVLDNAKGNPTYEDILGMKYMDMVISETLRKWPLGPINDRCCVKPYTLPLKHPEKPLKIEAKHSIYIPVYNIHHDVKYYSEPEKFIPERFSDENKNKIQSGTYMPFGTGPRACIGSRFALLEMKLMLFHLLDLFEIVPTEKTRIPLKLSKASLSITSEGGFPLALKRI